MIGEDKMRLSLKVALVLCLFTLGLSFSGSLAQTADISSVTSPTSVNLNSVCIVNNVTSVGNDLTMLNAWAVGDSGAIAQWDGNSWSTVPSPTTDNLYSVVFNNATNGWAVGGSAGKGILLHYDGTWSEWPKISFSGFTNTTDMVNSTLYSVTISVDGMTGWIVGADGISLNWDGDYWFGLPSASASTLRDVGMIPGSSDAWAVGDDGTIVHWTGTEWETMMSPTMEPLYSIEMIDANTGWAGGGSNNDGVVLQLENSQWSVVDRFVFEANGVPQTSVNSTIYGITAGSSTSAWACGSNGLVMYWTGTDWECNANIFSGNLRGISMIHDTLLQAWTVGDGGVIMAFNGTDWVPEFPIIVIPIILCIGLLVAVFGKLRILNKIPLIKQP